MRRRSRETIIDVRKGRLSEEGVDEEAGAKLRGKRRGR